ncbi:Na/Pi cotransporter family protein [Mesorhizobium marinum]|uniref:Na/Pi cotransporter family protein n=1 Tax=Mesorhizobium marinum TaxID=3228790 RepID=A0ABV3R4W9_9HYPH
MHISMILLHLAGAVMLLLVAVHMVRTGMERAHGTSLRRLLGHARRGRVPAAAGGAVMAVLLQSSTAVAILACGFAASGALPIATGIALLLGADLGSAIVVRVLSFDLNWLIPVCLLAGGILFLKTRGQKTRETGRMVLGIGFVLMSLQLIATATGPLRDGGMLPTVARYLAEDYVSAFLLGAAFTWLIHSSVASVLMFATFASQGLMSVEAAVPMVLGANLGGGLIAYWLSRGMPAEASRLPVANLLFRLAGSVLALALIETALPPFEFLGANAGAALVNLHLAFNAALVVFCLPFVGLMERMLANLISAASAKPADQDPLRRRISALDRAVIGTPRLALASATRELLRMGELVEVMVRPVMDVFNGGDRDDILRIQGVDAEVNQAHSDIKLYLAEVNRGEMTSEEAQRSIELTDFAINLEHAGDIVAKNLLPLALERAQKRFRFSDEGWGELQDLHQQLLENMHLALNVLVSQDLPSARQLVIEKERMRKLARASHDRHLKRLQTGTVESIETSSMHLEIARALKELNSLLATVAYPILKRSGDLLESRLVQPSHS